MKILFKPFQENGIYQALSKPSGFFFEFLQRDPSDDELAQIQKANKQSWFRDETFLGLYAEKEREYQSGNVLSFLAPELMNAIFEYIGDRAGL